MNISPVNSLVKFQSSVKPQDLQVKDNSQNVEVKNNEQKKYKDPLTNWPMRFLGYTNDIGIAISELNPTASRLFWVPALMYFGADIYDKYKNKETTYEPNAQRALTQAIFQACASIAFPAISGHIGMSVFSQLGKLKNPNLTTNAKEESLRFIKEYIKSHDVFNDNKNKTDIKQGFNDSFATNYKTNKGAIAKSNENNIKSYASKQFDEILNSCKKVDIADNLLDHKIFKQKLWKSVGAFTFIILSAKYIDNFVEKVIIGKLIEPQMEKLGGKSKQENSTEKDQQMEVTNNAPVENLVETEEIEKVANEELLEAEKEKEEEKAKISA